MIEFRPCGACGALVDARGCKHWKPGQPPRGVARKTPEYLARKAERDRLRRQADRDRAKVAKLQQQMGVRT